MVINILDKTMVQFVLENEQEPYVDGTKYKDIISYAKFLKTPLTLGMFVPTDEDEELLTIIPFHEHRKGSDFEFHQHCKYEEGTEKLIFNGFEVKEDMYHSTKRKIVWLNETEQIYREFHYHNGEIKKIFLLDGKVIEDLIPYKLTLKNSIEY